MLVLAVGPVKSAKLANEIVVAYLKITFLASELYVLRFAANHGVLEDAVAGADARKPLDNGIGANLAIWADFDLIFNDSGWVDRHF